MCYLEHELLILSVHSYQLTQHADLQAVPLLQIIPRLPCFMTVATCPIYWQHMDCIVSSAWLEDCLRTRSVGHYLRGATLVHMLRRCALFLRASHYATERYSRWLPGRVGSACPHNYIKACPQVPVASKMIKEHMRTCVTVSTGGGLTRPVETSWGATASRQTIPTSMTTSSKMSSSVKPGCAYPVTHIRFNEW